MFEKIKSWLKKRAIKKSREFMFDVIDRAVNEGIDELYNHLDEMDMKPRTSKNELKTWIKSKIYEKFITEYLGVE